MLKVKQTKLLMTFVRVLSWCCGGGGVGRRCRNLVLLKVKCEMVFWYLICASVRMYVRVYVNQYVDV